MTRELHRVKALTLRGWALQAEVAETLAGGLSGTGQTVTMSSQKEEGTGKQHHSQKGEERFSQSKQVIGSKT